LYELEPDVPELEGAVLLHYLDGYIDAGSAGSQLAEHIQQNHAERVIARFDVDRLIDYRSRRPAMSFAVHHWEDYRSPQLAVHLCHDAESHAFLLLTGPEPDHEWELFTTAVCDLVAKLDVRPVVGFHGIPMGVPHTRPLGLTAHATRPELVADYRQPENTVQVPGSAAGLLELRLGEQARDALGFAAHVPQYLGQSTYPAGALCLAEAVRQATGLALPTETLAGAANAAHAEIDKQVADSEEVTRVVKGLEEQYDKFMAGSGGASLLSEGQDVPTADELGSELERFLSEQHSRGETGEG
jgi:predicted ATP-grasp superfamily ATP-dependent carboligase